MSDGTYISIVAQQFPYTDIDGTLRCRWISSTEITEILDVGSVLPGAAVKIFGQKSDIGSTTDLPKGRVLCGHLLKPHSIGSGGTWVDYKVITEHKTTIILALPMSVTSIGITVKLLLYLRRIWYILRRGVFPTLHQLPNLASREMEI